MLFLHKRDLLWQTLTLQYILCTVIYCDIKRAFRNNTRTHLNILAQFKKTDI